MPGAVGLMKDTAMPRPPLPPFSQANATEKVRLAEDGWNGRNPEKVALAYTEDSQWRNRAEFLTGRAAIVSFLSRKWTRELDYRLIKQLWAFSENRIAVRLPMNTVTTAAGGPAPMATRTGNFALTA